MTKINRLILLLLLLPAIHSQPAVEFDAACLKTPAVVLVGFTLGEDGRVRDLEVLSGERPGCGLGEAAMRFFRNMPAWVPGYQNGRPVPVKMQMPITFGVR